MARTVWQVLQPHWGAMRSGGLVLALSLLLTLLATCQARARARLEFAQPPRLSDSSRRAEGRALPGPPRTSSSESLSAEESGAGGGLAGYGWGRPWVVLAVGGGCSLLIFAASWSQVQARRRAEREAAEARAAAQELRTSEQQFRRIFESLQEVYYRVDAADIVQAITPACRTQLGFEPEEMIGRPIPEFFQRPADYERLVRQMESNGSVSDVELLHRTKDGAGVWVSVNAQVVRDAAGRAIGREGTLRNITQRRRAEEEWLKTLQREQELAALKSRFVSMVSHEFRNPLGAILWAADILDNDGARLTEGQRRTHLQEILLSTRRMAHIMEEVLVWNRLEAGRITYQPDELDLEALCSRVRQETLTSAPHACPIHFQATHLPVPAVGDESLLRHILLNLLSNAVKYSAPGSPVDFAVSRQGEDAIFCIRDRGIGIPETDQAQLFAAFHRGQNVGHRPGTGVGLLVVRNCVELHEGAIRFESRVGQGTTFVVRLPMYRGHPVDPSPSGQTPLARAVAPALRASPQPRVAAAPVKADPGTVDIAAGTL